MKIFLLDGGLGNQVFQYIFYRFVQKFCTEPVYFDDRYFFYVDSMKGFDVQTHYQLTEVFGVTPNLLSEYFAADVWKEILDISQDKVHFLDLLRQNGLSLDVVSEKDWVAIYSSLFASMRRFYNMNKEYPRSYSIEYTGPYNSVDANEYHPSIAKWVGNIYYHGYWINGNYFKENRDILLDELIFPEITDKRNSDLAEQLQHNQSVAIHVRRGDLAALNWATNTDWYVHCINDVKTRIPSPKFFVFSDDPKWCRENKKSLAFTKKDDVVFVEGNSGKNAFRDMQLMSMCRNMIIANSSFSYLAALLNKNPDKLVVQPATRLVV